MIKQWLKKYGGLKKHDSLAPPDFKFHDTLEWRHNERYRMVSQITSLIQLFIHAQIKENIKAPRHWPLCREFYGDRWIPRTNGQ